MPCGFEAEIGNLPASWRIAKHYVEKFMEQAGNILGEGDEIKIVACGTSSATFSALWAGCPSIPTGAFVISTCTPPLVHYWDGSAWQGPFPLSSIQNSVRVVPSGAVVADFNSYFFDGAPPSTGAIVIVNSTPIRTYYSWNGISWQQFAYPNVSLQVLAFESGPIVTNSGPSTIAQINASLVVGDMVHVHWNLTGAIFSGSPTWAFRVSIPGYNTFDYTGSPGYVSGSSSYIAAATGNVLISTILQSASDFVTVQERRLSVAIIRNL